MSDLIKRVASMAARGKAFAALLKVLEHAEGQRPNLLRVLMYHRVDEPDAHLGLYPGLVSATPAAFEEQAAYLAAHYQVVALPQVLAAVRTGTPLPPRSVLLTFDDATRDFAEHAWPILLRHRLPATLFVPTGFPGQPTRAFWWDRLYQAIHETEIRDPLSTALGALPLATPAERGGTFDRFKEYVKTLPHGDAMALVDRLCEALGVGRPERHLLSWDELRRLAREGVTLGAHSRNHPLLNRVSLAEARAEAVGSLRDLEREVGPVPPVFAYPSGGFDGAVVRALREEGFELAFTTASGINDLGTGDHLQLRRIHVGRRTTLSVLRAQLLAWTVCLNRCWPLAAG
jgi:peptidoglycan/xylan/chitin deacetylase (PgdA/CDA1 family)